MNARSFVFAGCGAIATLALADFAGIRLNVTDSAPKGLWFMTKSLTPERGSFVAVCPPPVPAVKSMVGRYYLPSGNCIETGSQTLLKAIGAISGDSVVIRDGLPVSVNGSELPNTVARNRSLSWPAGTYQVESGYVWVFSTYNEKSFDSRYFGPVPVKNIRGVSVPVLTDGDTDQMKTGIPHA